VILPNCGPNTMCVRQSIQVVRNAQANNEWRHEVAFTGRLVEQLARRAEIRKIWTGISHHLPEQNCQFEPSYRSPITGIENDISYSSDPNSDSPESIVQVKLGGGTRPEARHQEPLHFLADCLNSAINQLLSPVEDRWVIAWLPIERLHNRWERIIPEGDVMELIIDPEEVNTRVSENDDWMNNIDGCIQPTSRSDVRMLVTKATNPTIIGFYNRPRGFIRARFRVWTVGESGTPRVVIYRLLTQEYNGQLPFREWLP